MANIDKIQTIWTGFTGAPGYTTWYFQAGVANKAAQMRVFMDAVKGNIPSTVTLQVQNTGLTIDEVTGAAVGTWTEGAVTAVVGTAVGVYSAPSGAVVDWLTSSFIAGRRLRGRTFLVPLSGNIYQNDGTIGAAPLTVMVNAAAAFIVANTGTFVIWKRPVGGGGGTSSAVTSSVVPDKAVVLRSRRD